MLGRSKAEGGREGKEEEEEVRMMENEVIHAILSSCPIESTARADAASVVDESNAERGSSGDVAEELFQHVDQSWDFQLEEMRRDWQGGRKDHDEEK